MSHNKKARLFTELVLETFRFNGALLAVGDRLTADFGLTSARWQVMGAVVDEPLTVPHIARQMGLTRQAVQKTVNLLVKESLIEFQPNPNHQASRLVALTGEGSRRYAALDAVQQDWANRTTKKMKYEELNGALRTVQALRRTIEGTKS